MYYCCAINYHEHKAIPGLQLLQLGSCPHCKACLFHHETTELGCLFDKINLPLFPIPNELLALYREQTSDAQHFRKNIRKYNHIFSFTSMGVHIDEILADVQHRGVYLSYSRSYIS